MRKLETNCYLDHSSHARLGLMLQNHLPGQEGTIHDNKDMEKLDLLLVITPHSVSLSQIESLTPGDTLSSNAHFILTTQQKKIWQLKDYTAQLDYRYTLIQTATIILYLLSGRHHVGNNSLARLMSIYFHFISEKTEAPRIQVTQSGSQS